MLDRHWLAFALVAVAAAGLLGLAISMGLWPVHHFSDVVARAMAWLVAVLAAMLAVGALHRRRQRTMLMFVGEGGVYNPQRGMVLMAPGESVLAALRRALAREEYPDNLVRFNKLDRPSFDWMVRTRAFRDDGAVWTGEVVSVHHPDREPMLFSSGEELALLLRQVAD